MTKKPHNQYKPTTVRDVLLDQARVMLEAVVAFVALCGISIAAYAWLVVR